MQQGKRAPCPHIQMAAVPMTDGRAYEVLDVFTETAFEGNPLAVVHDADGLDDRQMQRIAAEFALSETVFVLPPTEPGRTARLRIFTPARELPFAGHPTVGAAVALARREPGYSAGVDQMIVLEEGVGLVRCVVTGADSAAFAEFDLPKMPALLHTGPDADAVAAALGIERSAIGFGRYTVTVADAGMPFVFVPVSSLAALGAATPALQLWPQTFPPEHSSVYLFTVETAGSGATFRTRMFAPALGVHEDPATGSAVAAFAAAIAAWGDLPDGEHAILVEQGVEMGRRSLIRLELGLADGAIAAARLGGHAVAVARGSLIV